MQPANQVPIRLSWLLAVIAGGAVIAALSAPRVAQDPAYHQFADSRPMLGIPNSLNMLSNLPFASSGWPGSWRCRACATGSAARTPRSLTARR